MESTKFQKGNIPWNKGKKGFVHNGSFKKSHAQSNTGRTHFKKGHIPWSKNHKELMSEPWNKSLEFRRLNTTILQKTKINLTKMQCAYLAGFVDADGCIQIEGKNGENKKTWTLTVTLYNCDNFALEKMRDWIGSGKVKCRDRNPEKWNKSYALRYRAATAAKIIKRIVPYMLVKKEQGDVAMEFLKTFGRDNHEGSSWQGGRKVKKEALQKREQLKQKMQSLTGTANYLGKNINKNDNIS